MNLEIPDPLFREAVAAIDAGDVGALERLLAAHPRLLRERADCGEGYFRQPYLLWFVAENPIRNGKLPADIARVTRVIVEAAEREGVASLREQIDYALGLVGSGCVPRTCGVQRALIDVLCDAGADPGSAVVSALAHREVDAVERLLERGARRTLPVAAALGTAEEVARLAGAASAEERQVALAAAAVYGRAEAAAKLIEAGVDLNAYCPQGFHPHGTPLHQAVAAGSLETVRVLVEAGADTGVKDRVHQGRALGWAEHFQHAEIAAYLRQKGERRQP